MLQVVNVFVAYDENRIKQSETERIYIYSKMDSFWGARSIVKLNSVVLFSVYTLETTNSFTNVYMVEYVTACVQIRCHRQHNVTAHTRSRTRHLMRTYNLESILWVYGYEAV